MGRYNFNENYFECIDNEHKAYWLGYLFADGCIYKAATTNFGKEYFVVQLSLGIADISVLERLKSDIEIDKKIYVGTYKSKNKCGEYCRLGISSNKMASDLMKIGCVPRKSQIVKFPEIRKDLERHFIRGFFDGNGSIYASERKNVRISGIARKDWGFCFNSTSYMLNSIKDILNENNIHTSKIRPGHGNVYVLEGCSRNSIRNLYHYLYDNSTIFLERKKDKFISFYDYWGNS